jgi:NAD-dependent deacetylase
MSVLFVTGAGISANAGIPTYRDTGSSWRDKDLEKKSHSTRYGNHLDELWDKMWGPMSEQMRMSAPTKTHLAIADFGWYHPIATQNIDTLHELAGSGEVNHLHGAMNLRCMRCKTVGVTGRWIGSGAPACSNCGSCKTRPDVVLFGESLNTKMFKAMYKAAYEADHIVAIGTSLNVVPAAQLVVDFMEKSIIINKEPVAFQKYVRKVYNEDADLVINEVLDSL